MEPQILRKKVFVQNMLLVCISLIFSLGMGEIIVRAYQGLEKPDPQVVADPVLLIRLVGSEYDTNGFRNSHVPEQADIVALGDSMTNGQNTTSEGAWPKIVGSLASTSVYNMGIGGYGPVQYAYLSKQALSLKPKIIVIGFYLGNDLYDAYNAAYHLDAWKALRDPSFTDPNATLATAFDQKLRTESLAGSKRGTLKYNIFVTRLWLRDHVRLYALLGDATRAFRERSGMARTTDDQIGDLKGKMNDDPNMAMGYDADPAIKTVLSPIYRYDAVNISATTTKEGWRITRELFSAMHEAYSASGTEMVIVAIPTKEAMYLRHMHNTGEEIPEKFRAYEAAEMKLLSSFFEYCEQEKIRCMSPLSDLTSALDEHKTIVRPVMDGHPLPLGYQVIAESVYKYLLTEKLLPITQKL